MPGPRLHSSSDGRQVARTVHQDEASVRVILLDIEGTTTPIDFVYQTLFPFANQRLDAFLREHFDDQEIRAQIDALKAQQKTDQQQGLDPPKLSADSAEAELNSLVAYAQWLIARDSKNTALKAIQGRIWKEGYESGELRGQVFPDVPGAFERWRRQGKQICIYSSGSILAQQLLFRTTPSGDLTVFLRDFFDTKIGIKTDAASYGRIAASLRTSARSILFLSDAVQELDAAREAGIQTALCVRAEPGERIARAHPAIRTFDEVFP